MDTLKKYLPWALVIVVVSTVGVIIFMPAKPAVVPTSQLLGQAYAIQGQDHIEIGAKHIAYNSNPPTSGPHYTLPAAWGVYQTELPDEQLVHNLEHGGIWISYKNIDATTKAALENIARSNPKMIMTPRKNDDANFVLASWGQLQKFDTYNEAAVLAFIKANKNQSPEPQAQ